MSSMNMNGIAPLFNKSTFGQDIPHTHSQPIHDLDRRQSLDNTSCRSIGYSNKLQRQGPSSQILKVSKTTLARDAAEAALDVRIRAATDDARARLEKERAERQK